MKFFTVDMAEGDVRLDRWIARHHPQITHGKLRQALRKGWIKLDGKKAESAARLAPGMTIGIAPSLLALEANAPAKSAPVALSDAQIQETRAMVIYEDDDCYVLNKPAGLAVQGGSGIKDSVDARLEALRSKEGERPKLVHRLDKDTSGALLVAKSAKSATYFTKAFAGKDVRKLYLALAIGVPEPRTGKIDAALAKQGSEGREKMRHDEEGKRAISLYHVMEAAHRQLSLLELSPVTGRTHQLRVHLAEIGHPILGDGKYGGREAFIPSMELPKQLHLHAWRVVVPGTGLDVMAPLPEHMRISMKELGFDTPADSLLLETMV